MSNEYLHGFSKEEQNRLLHQAEFLKQYVYESLNLPSRGTLLEVGCGVGAQTKIILKERPLLKIHGIDRSLEQLSVASNLLKIAINSKRVELFQADAMTFQLEKQNYDGAFLCWFLEHVPNPLEVLKRVKRHLKPGASIFCSEVFNQTLFLEPYAPNMLKYWFHFNDLQWTINGHPFVGAKLGHLLSEAGFKHIEVKPVHLYFDSRTKKQRALFSDYFLNILLSAQDKLIADKRVTRKEVESVKKEFEQMKKRSEGIFYYAFMQATAKA